MGAGQLGDQPLRADAERNRASIVVAAQRTFAEHGLEASLGEIARRAGVGEATLYRRFPDRASLIAAAFGEKMAEYSDAASEAAKAPDPWAGFCSYVRRVCELQAEDRGFADLLTRTFTPVNPAIQELEDRRDSGLREWLILVRNAKASGQLRADFEPEDMILLLMANAGVVSATADHAPNVWRRFIEYMLQSFSADHAAPLPAPAPRVAMHRAMERTQRPGPKSF